MKKEVRLKKKIEWKLRWKKYECMNIILLLFTVSNDRTLLLIVVTIYQILEWINNWHSKLKGNKKTASEPHHVASKMISIQ